MATEEQTSHNTSTTLFSGGNERYGQKLTISDRTVSKLSFPIYKYGSPSGDVTFTIRAVSANGYAADEIINSKVLCDADDLETTATWEEVEFDIPISVNEEVRISVEFSGGNATNCVIYRYQNTDVKADECLTHYTDEWFQFTTRDAAYIYTYTTGGTTVTPGTASLTTSKYIPVLKLKVTPSTLTQSDTEYAPVLKLGLTPSLLAHILTEYAPILKEVVTPSKLSLTITTYIPVLKEVTTPTTLALTTTGHAPILKEVLTPIKLDLTLTEYAPTIIISSTTVVTPSTLSLALTSYTPILKAKIIVSLLALVLTGYAPAGWAKRGPFRTSLLPLHLYEATLRAERKYSRTFMASHLYETKMEAEHKYTAKLEAK